MCIHACVYDITAPCAPACAVHVFAPGYSSGSVFPCILVILPRKPSELIRMFHQQLCGGCLEKERIKRPEKMAQCYVCATKTVANEEERMLHKIEVMMTPRLMPSAVILQHMRTLWSTSSDRFIRLVAVDGLTAKNRWTLDAESIEFDFRDCRAGRMRLPILSLPQAVKRGIKVWECSE
jgi:hypothetical protein